MARLKNRKHERFARIYVTNGFNQTAAARGAGYSRDSARQQGYELMKKPDIVNRVTELTADIEEKELIMTPGELLAEASRLASFDLADLYDENGKLMSIEEMPRDVTTSINEIEIEALEVEDPDTGERTIIHQPVKIKVGRDKKFGMDLLAKYHNLLEKHQQAGATINTIVIDAKDEQA